MSEDVGGAVVLNWMKFFIRSTVRSYFPNYVKKSLFEAKVREKKEWKALKEVWQLLEKIEHKQKIE